MQGVDDRVRGHDDPTFPDLVTLVSGIRWRLCGLLLALCLMIEAVFILSATIHLGAAGPRYVARMDNETDTGPTEPPFLETIYRPFCELVILPRSEGNAHLPLCPCAPDTLVGATPVTFEAPTFGELELMHPELGVGGHWRPTHCKPRSKTVVIVPFRDREEHLRIFLHRLHPMLQRQMLHYRIVVVEQSRPSVFNKAAMMNVGFREARGLGDVDCFVFHDVDMLPETDHNMYTCSTVPRHVASHCDKWNYTVPYAGLFGGATAFTEWQFEKVNGFSNQYYGWGGEDDDMYNRVRAARMNITRHPASVARYTMIKHTHDRGNPYNKESGKAWGFRPKHYPRDGLNTLRYTKVAVEYRPLYTWVLASVPDAALAPAGAAGASAAQHGAGATATITAAAAAFWWQLAR